MLSLKPTPSLTHQPRGRSSKIRGLHVAREDIVFYNPAPDLVRLEVTVHNSSARSSVPATMEVRAASFGAFVESKPVAELGIPSIPPFGSTLVTTDFSDPSTRSSRAGSTLPEDPMRSLLRGRVHWAGNFDIHIREAAAERHCAAAVRLMAGKTNVAFFFVGKQADAYRFTFQGNAADWTPQLIRDPGPFLRAYSARTAFQNSEIQVGAWTEMSGRTMVSLLVSPPEWTTEGLLAVQVEQCSSGNSALVEFGFGVDTIPPRCFRD